MMAPKPPPPVEALLFALCLFVYAYAFDPAPGTNARAHFDQTVAIVEHGTLSIERVLLTPEGYTIDWSLRDGRYYPAKAPGLSILGVPVYAAATALERAAGADPLAPEWFRRNGTLLSWALSSLPAAFGALAMLRLALALGAPLEAGVLGALAIALGTSLAPFASVLYAHAPTAAALAGAGALALAGEPGPRRAAAAGFLVGVATLITYQAAIAVFVIGGAFALRARRPAPVLWFAAGGAPALLAFAALHAAMFGAPWRTAYDFQNPCFGGGGYASIMEPIGAGRLGQVLFGSYRGLFFYSPVVAAALVALVVDLARGAREQRIAAGAALAVFAAFVLVTAMHPLWHGGFSAGPRLLVPGLALLAPFAARAYERWPKTTAALASISTAHALAVTAFAVTVDEKVPNPLFTLVYPALGSGMLGRTNAGIALLDLAGFSSLVPGILGGGGLAVALALAVRRAGPAVVR